MLVNSGFQNYLDQIGSEIILATSLAPIATVLETKIQNPIIKTACKIAALVPAAALVAYRIGEAVWCWIYDRGRPFNSFEQMDEAIKSANRWGVILSTSVQAGLLALPIGFHLLKNIAQKHHCTKCKIALDISEKVVMTVSKVITIALLVFGVFCLVLKLTPGNFIQIL